MKVRRKVTGRRGPPGGQGARRGLLCAGNFIVDYVKMIDRFPTEESCIEITSMKTANGGAPYNMLVDLAHAKVGFPLSALGLVGDDPEGRGILAHCRRLKIDTRALGVAKGARTSFSDILTTEDAGRRTIVQHHGANALLDRKHFATALPRSRAKILHLAFLALLKRLDAPSASHGTVAAEILARAQSLGFVTSSDVVTDVGGRLPRLVFAALPHLDYFFINEIEAEILTGVRPRRDDGTLDRTTLELAGRSLLDRGMRGWLVLHTAEAAVALRDGEPARWHGSVQIPRDRIAGTNGAGDAFAAGFLAGVHDDRPIEECLRTGVCVAASSLLDSTPSDGVRPLPACLALGERYGFRA